MKILTIHSGAKVLKAYEIFSHNPMPEVKAIIERGNYCDDEFLDVWENNLSAGVPFVAHTISNGQKTSYYFNLVDVG